MRRRLKLAALAMLATGIANADNYKILQMNTSSVKIGNKICGKNDVFSDRDIIYWSKETQAFKAQNTSSKQIRLFAAPDFKRHKSKTINEYILRTTRLSTRGGMSLSELEEYLTDEFFMLDSIMIETTERTDSARYFMISYEDEGKTVKKRTEGEDGWLIIDRSILPDNKAAELKLSVSYVNEKINEEYKLTDSMKITLLPLKDDD